jgi:transposase-like protein
MKENEVKISKQSKDNKIEIRAQAVFAMIKGESVKEVSERFEICRSTLYQLRR